jgi:hypothetical protein
MSRASAPPVLSSKRRLAGSVGSSDAFLKRLQMRDGRILSRPSANNPDVAVRIDSLDPVDAASWDNAVSVHPASMAIGSHRKQSEPETKGADLPKAVARQNRESQLPTNRIREMPQMIQSRGHIRCCCFVAAVRPDSAVWQVPVR